MTIPSYYYPLADTIRLKPSGSDNYRQSIHKLIEKLIAESPKQSLAHISVYILLHLMDVVVDDTDDLEERSLYVFNQYGLVTDFSFALREIVVTVAAYEDKLNEMESAFHHAHTLLTGTPCYLHKMIPYRPAPSHVHLFNNGVFNMETGERLSDEEAQHYHFHTRTYLNFHSEPSPVGNYIVHEVFDEWSNHDPEVKLLLFQILRALLEGNNRERMILLQGEGGNGKSTFLDIATKLVGESNTLLLDLDEYGDRFAFSKVTPHTKFIRGDNLVTNYRIGKRSSSYLKKIVHNQVIMKEEKYQKAIPITTNILIIQATNTDVHFSNHSSAIRDKVIRIPWGTTNGRQKKREGGYGYDLDRLVQHDSFIEDVLAIIYNETSSFDSFIVPKQIAPTADSSVTSNGRLTLFMEYLEKNGIVKQNSLLPTTYLYHLYEEWEEQENPGGSILAKRIVTEQLAPYLEKYGFYLQKCTTGKVTNVRLAHLSPSEWDMELFTSLIRKPKPFPKTSSFFQR